MSRQAKALEPRKLEALLNEFLGRETSAEDTYRLAVGILAGRSRKGRLLRGIAEHHVQAARFFRDYLVENGARPAAGRGSWSRFAGSSSFRRERPLDSDTVERLMIASLREGELRSLQDYRRAVDREKRLTEEVRDYLRGTLIPRCSLHVDALDMLVRS